MRAQRSGLAAHRAARRRRVAHRQLARGRWAPPGHSPAADVSMEASGLFELFEDATLPSLWRDTGADAGATPSTPGAGLVMDPTTNSYCEVMSRVPLDLTGKSVTWRWEIDPSTFDYKESYVELALRNAAGGYVYDVALSYDSSASAWKVYVDGDGGLTEAIETTDASEWAYVRIDSDPADPGQVTVYYSADGLVWATAGTDVIDPSLITSLRPYSYAYGAAWLLAPIVSTFDNLTGWATTGDAAIDTGRLVLGGTTGAGTAEKTLSFDFTDHELNCEAWPDPGNTGTASWRMEAFRNSDSEYIRIGVDTATGDIVWETSLNGATLIALGTNRFFSMIPSLSSGAGGFLVFRHSPTDVWGDWNNHYAGSMSTDLQGGTAVGFDGVRFTFTSTVATDKWYVDNLNTQR